MNDTVRIATRGSKLALWQAEHVKARLQANEPGLAVELVVLKTTGDKILDRPLSEVGGKGLFVKEIEEALLDGRADIAVHSMKDVPVNLPPGFVIAAITRREDPTDAFVSNRYDTFSALPAGAVVGTSSLRRESQLRARRPDLRVEALRGNVQTRLRKLDEGQYDAILLATAGLKRLGLADRIRTTLSEDESLPAVGQGALGIECRADRQDLLDVVSILADDDTAFCVRAERAMSRALAGNCTAPLGGFARIEGGIASLAGFVALPDGSRMVRGKAQAAVAGTSPESLGQQVADQLIGAGAREILAAAEAAK